jgi:hypothetical protein
MHTNRNENIFKIIILFLGCVIFLILVYYISVKLGFNIDSIQGTHEIVDPLINESTEYTCKPGSID